MRGDLALTKPLAFLKRNARKGSKHIHHKMETTVPGIPVVDFSAFSIEHKRRPNTDSDEVKELARNIFHAFSTVGFVYLKNHGISQSQMDKVLGVMDDFFLLPEKTKSKYEMPEPESHGWLGVDNQGRFDKTIPRDLRENFAMSDGFLDEPHWWPDKEVPSFKPTVQSYFSQLRSLGQRVLSAIAIGLSLDANTFEEFYKHLGTTKGHATLVMNFYPAITNDINLGLGQTRFGEHTDFGAITLLLQDEAGGLEVETVQGSYVQATPIKGTIIVNIGDLMQRWTSDRLKSNFHHVRMSQQGSQRRRSVAFFLDPDKEAMIRCLDGTDKYPPIQAVQYVKDRLKDMYML